MRSDRRMEPPEGGGGVAVVSSGASYKSTHSSRSSVLERAREYNRRIDEQKLQSMTAAASTDNNSISNNSNNNSYEDDSRGRRRRSKSWERSTDSVANSSSASNDGNSNTQKSSSPTKGHGNNMRSQSTGRIPHKSHGGIGGNGNISNLDYAADPTRIRALESVRHPKTRGPSSERTHPLTPSGHSTQYSSSQSSSRAAPEAVQQHQQRSGVTPAVRHSNSSQSASKDTASSRNRHNAPQVTTPAVATSPQEEAEEPVAVVPPELLVEALSGQEDGLLAIAEKLMEHYDAGYDVMGEAIIDAFADVQKLFQHVVEAAHMEGAAFEAARREEEQMMDQQLQGGGANIGTPILNRAHNAGGGGGPSSPQTASSRPDEFLDQDVKDLLSEAIRTGSVWRSENRNVDDIFHLYLTACMDASNLLAVDSDHRTRLQLSVNRAESMTPDRACAILRYGIDDVLRSGLRAEQAPAPSSDPNQQQRRAENVLQRNNLLSSSIGNAAVVQSSDEALASLMEELKDMLQAPIYADTPLEHVSRRFWAALTDAQKMQQKNEERLEQSLGKLKGEFLLAQAEWEEKLSQSNTVAESFQKKYQALIETMRKEESRDTINRNGAVPKSHGSHDDHDISSTVYGSVKSAASKAETVASGVSGLAQQARSLVMNSSFNCVAGGSTVNGGNHPDDDFDDEYGDGGGIDDMRGEMEFETSPPQFITRGRSGPSDQHGGGGGSRSSSKTPAHKRYYSRSPHRVDI